MKNINFNKIWQLNTIILVILIFFIYYRYNFYYPFYTQNPKFSNMFYNTNNHLTLDKIINKGNKLKNIKMKTSENIVFLFSYDYKTMPIYYNKMKNIFIEYCNLHGYEFLEFDHSKDTIKNSPYWNRVIDLINLSKKYNQDTVFVYLDLDTYINYKYRHISIDLFLNSIDNIENRVSDIYIGNDPYHTSNAGIIIIRNTDWSKQFLNLWWSKYNPDNWKIVNDKWVCKKNDKICNWGREGYEQGEFNIIYENNEINAQEHINILHYSLISNSNIYIDSFIYHFYGNMNDVYHSNFIRI